MNRKYLVMAAAAVVSFVIAACGGGGGGGSSSGGITTSTCTSANISGTRTTGINADVAYAVGTTDAITIVNGWASSSSGGQQVAPATGVTPRISWSGSAASIVIQQKVNISGTQAYDPIYVVDGAAGGDLPASPYTYGKATGVVIEKDTYAVLPNGDYQAVVIRKTATNDYDCKNFTVVN